jgi:hypothetical protein
MVQLLLKILLVLTIYQSDNATTIRIDHVGASDKPIPSLCISVSLATCSESGYEKGIVVSNDEMREMEKFVRDNKTSMEFNAQSAYETGSFKITILKNHTTDLSYVIESKENAIDYLTLLKTLSTRKKSSLQEELNNILKRIDY